jgi:cephalosporin-C deacetylase
VSFIDLPLDALRSYLPSVAEPDDFDAFWQSTLAESRALAEAPTLVPADTPITGVEVFDVTFSGFGGDPIKGWFMRPRSGTTSLPTIVEYNGYGGGRGFAHERLPWVSAGYAYLFMDTRGQGSVWGSGGGTADPHGSGPAVPGYMTRGIVSPETYFYRRVYTDAVLAIDAVRGFDRVDPQRVAVCGGSQGGGIAIAAAVLAEGVVAAMPEVPFLQNFERAVGFTDSDPYAELTRYLAVHRDAKTQVFRTLSYFDGVNFAKRAKCPAFYSVGLMDPICPPSTVFGSFNHWAGEKQIEVYEFNEHEGGQGYHWGRQANWLRGILGA